MNSSRPHVSLYIKKLIASFLAFLFIISPLGVFAQSPASTSVISETPASGATTSSGTSPHETTTGNPSSTEAETSSQSSGIFQISDKKPSDINVPPPSLLDSAPGNGTEVDVGKNAIKSGYKLEPSIFDGSLQYEVPLTLPPGRNGLEPQLSLLYSSRPSQESNLFGRGWSATIPYIERRNYAGVDELYNLPTYFSSLDGELASTTAPSIFKPKNDSGSFLQYELTASTTAGNTHSLDLESNYSQYASIADASQTGLDLTADLTLSTWIKIESFAGGTLIRKGRGDDNQKSYVMFMDSSSISVYFSSDGGSHETESVSWSPSLGTWYHLAVTRSGSTVKFYVNGVQQGGDQTNSIGTLFNSNRPFLIGTSENSGGGPEGLFDGLIDDVRVWSRALSSSEVSSLYASPGSFNNGSSLQGFWKFNNSYADDSGNSNTLTGQNSPSFSTDVPDTSVKQWTVTDKQGRTYKFGHATSTRLYDETGGSGRIYRWMLEEVRDLNDNYISYSYTRDSNQLYPDVITYTGNGSSAGKFNVRFTKEPRGDIATSSIEGFNVVTKYRINNIEADVDNSWVRKYGLGYTTGDNGERSLLSSVTESGFDGTSTTSLENITFAAATSTDSWSSATSTWSIPEPIVGTSYEDIGARFADVNGDGLPDFLRRDDNEAVNVVYMNKGDGTWLTSSWTISINLRATTTHPGNLIMDVNGDGLADILQHKAGSSNQIYLNSGSGWSLSSLTLPVPLADSDGKDYGVRTADINGDGLYDLVVYNEAQNRNAVYLNNGSGFATSTGWALPQVTLDSNKNDLGTRFADVNGDGLADLLRSDATVNKVYLNTGTGFELSTTWILPSSLKFMDGGSDQGVRIEDVNGDGLADLIRNATTSSPNGVWLNTGKGWSLDSSWTVPLPTLGFDSQKDIGTRLLDLNGDGLLDMVKRRASEANEIYLRNGRRPDLMATTTNPRGGKIGVSYQSSPQYRSGSAVANPNLPINLDMVKTLTYDDRIGSSTQKTFSYDGGQYYTGNIRDRKFAGFATTTETDGLGFVTKRFFHQGSTTQSTIGEYQDHISKIGKVYRTEVYDDANNIYQKTINKWDRFDRGDGASFVFLSEMLDITHDGDASTKSKAEAYSYNTASGTLIQKIEYGEVTGSNDGTFSDTGTDKFTTGYQYATSTATSTILALSQEQTLDQSSNKVRERKMYYDTLSQGSLTKGNPTKEELWMSGSNYIDTEKSYDSFGLVTQEKDPRDNTTTYVYDAAKLYSATTTSPIGHVTERIYDYSSGKPTRLTDSNGNIFETVYDGLDRVTEEKEPDLVSTTTLVTKATYQYTDTGPPTRVLKTDYLNSATSSESYIYFDGFGRKIQERIETEDAGVYSAKNTRYDERGLVKTESLPYFSNNTAYMGTSSPPASYLLTTFSYDPKDRVKSIANSVGSTTYAYNDWTVTTYDPNSNRKDFANDAYGNLITVTEYSPSATTTQYQYDGNNKLIKITDSSANVRNFTYDGLGRRLTAEDLHASGDGTFGTWAYVYDAASNIATTTDPNSQTINYFYDSLNRLTSEDYTGNSGTEISYTYDTCTNGKGRLCIASTTAVYTSTAYNALGMTAAEAKRIGGTQYASTTFAYDRQGNYTGITYPDAREVAYTYDSAGKLGDVKTRASGGAWNTILSDIDYAPHGAPSLYVYGNGISIPRTYDDTKLYRLTRIGDSNSSAVQDINYTYDAVGNITGITDNSSSGAGKTVLFTYDTLNRLTSASTTAASSTPYYEAYIYNTLGNLLSKGPAAVSTTTVSTNTHSIDLEQSSSQYASISDANQVGLDLTPPLTISLWIKMESAPGNLESRDMVAKYNPGAEQRSYRWTYQESSDCGPGNTCMHWGTSTDGAGAPSVATAQWNDGDLTVGAWHHVVLRQTNGTTARMFLDGADIGAPSGTLNSSIFNSTTQLNIGGGNFGDNDGLIDDVRVWSRVLSDSEISALYTSPDTFQNGADLKGYWKFDGGYTDASTNANTLTGHNSPVFATDVAFSSGGTITTSTTTTYSYAGTNYANPHAVTQITPATAGQATTTFVYDNNGNLTQSGTVSGTTTYAWDYRNRLTGSATSTATGTTTYLYDHADQRVRKSDKSATTTYIGKFYDTTSSTATTSASTTAYIWVGDTVVATVEANGYATSTYFVHPDHLGSANVITNSAGTVKQAIDYYPYGEERINTNSNLSRRTFIDQFYDREQSLSYLNARYYQNSRGQFLSEDSVFWSGSQNLADPQSTNSYSYARNNPVRYKDPQGTCPICVAAGFGAVGGIGIQAFSDYYSGEFSQRTWSQNLSTYLVAAGQGAVVGSGVAATGFLTAAAGFSTVGGTISVSGVSGILAAGTTVIGNRMLGKPTDPAGLAINTAMSTLTVGTFETASKLTPLPKIAQKISAGTYIQRQAAGEFYSSSMQLYSQFVALSFSPSPTTFSVSGSGGGGSGGGSGNSLIQQLRSLISSLQSLVASLSTSRSTGNKK